MTVTLGAAPASPGPMTFSWIPGGDVNAALGAPVSLSIQVTNAADLYTVSPIRVKFDPSKLRLNDAEQGELLTRDGMRVSLSKDIRNDSGEATIAITRTPGSAGVSGAGGVIRLQFTGVAPGQSQVVIEQLGAQNSQAQGLSVTPPAPVKINLK